MLLDSGSGGVLHVCPLYGGNHASMSDGGGGGDNDGGLYVHVHG